MAAGFPFSEVIEVEFSRELHETALQNISRVAPEIVKCGKVSSVHCDATSFEPPKSNLVCYFYNPFGPPVMTAVAARLSALYDHFGCQIIIIYLDPRHSDVFEATGNFVVLDKTPNAVVLSTSVQGLTPSMGDLNEPAILGALAAAEMGLLLHEIPHGTGSYRHGFIF